MLVGSNDSLSFIEHRQSDSVDVEYTLPASLTHRIRRDPNQQSTFRPTRRRLPRAYKIHPLPVLKKHTRPFLSLNGIVSLRTRSYCTHRLHRFDVDRLGGYIVQIKKNPGYETFGISLARCLLLSSCQGSFEWEEDSSGCVHPGTFYPLCRNHSPLILMVVASEHRGNMEISRNDRLACCHLQTGDVKRYDKV